MRRLGVGIVGLGVGRHHAAAFASHPQCTVAALCDHHPDKLEAVGREYPQARRTTSAQEVLDGSDVDIVSVASYDEDHYAQVLRALGNGKHVLVEKPVCMVAGQLAEIVAKWRECSGLRISSNMNLRTCPAFSALRAAMKAGELGQIISVEGDYLWGQARMHRLRNGWRTDMEHYSILLGASVHLVDLILWLVGQRPVEVMAWGNDVAMRGSRCKHPDFAMLMLRFPDGLVAKVTASGGCAHPHFHGLRVLGTEASFLNELSGARMIRYEAGDQPPAVEGRYPDHKESGRYEVRDTGWEYPGISRKGELILSFVDAVLDSGKEPLVPEDDVFATMSVCLAGEESLSTGRPVTVKYAVG